MAPLLCSPQLVYWGRNSILYCETGHSLSLKLHSSGPKDDGARFFNTETGMTETLPGAWCNGNQISIQTNIKLLKLSLPINLEIVLALMLFSFHKACRDAWQPALPHIAQAARPKKCVFERATTDGAVLQQSSVNYLFDWWLYSNETRVGSAIWLLWVGYARRSSEFRKNRRPHFCAHVRKKVTAAFKFRCELPYGTPQLNHINCDLWSGAAFGKQGDAIRSQKSGPRTALTWGFSGFTFHFLFSDLCNPQIFCTSKTTTKAVLCWTGPSLEPDQKGPNSRLNQTKSVRPVVPRQWPLPPSIRFISGTLFSLS